MGVANNKFAYNSKYEYSTSKNVSDSYTGTMLFTKLMVPGPPSNYINRTMLTSRLEEILDKKLTVISAPAGYGKTTLVSIWLTKKGTSIRTAWVSLDEKDNEVQVFWKYVLMALEKSVSGTVEYYISTDFSIMADSIELLINGLLNRLSKIPYDIVLVIDDYHIISEESIHASMRYFIKHLPHNIHIIITSRTIPGIKLARFRGHGDLLELDTEDLRLIPAEASEFLTGTMKLSMNEIEAKRLGEWTEGWIAALSLAALKIKSCGNARSFFNDNSHIKDYMVEYMSEEIFSLLGMEEKSFLIKTSILDTLNCSLCDAVAGIGNSQAIIDVLEKNNLFTSSLDNKKNSYRYHSIFADFLKNKLMESFPGEAAGLYLKASRWYEENGMPLEALEYSVRINNYENSIRLIKKYGEIFIINRDLIKLANIIEALPNHLIVADSKLCVLYTMAVAGKNDSGNNGIFIGGTLVSYDSSIFIEAEEELLLIRMIIAYGNENFKTALECGNQMLERMPEKSRFQILMYKMLIHIYSATGDAEKAGAYLRSYIVAIKDKAYYDELFIEMIDIHIMVHILCGVGNYKAAIDRLSKFEKKLNSYNILLPAAANSIYLDLGYLYYEFGEIELSYNNAIKCIEISSIKTDVYRLISGYILISRIYQNMGKYDEMLDYVTKAVELCDKHNSRMMIYNTIYYIVRALLSAGQTGYADSLIEKYDIRVYDSFDVLYEEIYLALADLYIVKGELVKAECILNMLYQEVIKTERNLSIIRTMILKALLSARRGDDTEALNWMKIALELSSKQGYISIFSDFGTSVAEIICKLISAKGEFDFTDEECAAYAASILSHIKKPGGIDPELLKDLSRRETEVLNYIFSGLTNKEIAERLYVAESTVKKHINSIYAKIGAVDRIQIRKANI